MRVSKFWANEVVRHELEPGLLSDSFLAFTNIAEQKQRANLAYRIQANGTAERMVQTLTRAIKMHVANVD